MSVRNVMIQYVGDILYLPKFERPVRRIIEQRHDISPFDRQEFRPVKTCRNMAKSKHGLMFSCSKCGFVISCGLYYTGEECYCPKCGARVVQGE